MNYVIRNKTAYMYDVFYDYHAKMHTRLLVRCIGVIDTEGQRLDCKWLIMEASYAPAHCKQTQTQQTSRDGDGSTNKRIARAILLTDRSIMHVADQQDITLLSYPREGRLTPITLYEAGNAAYVTPAGLYVVHLTCVCERSAAEDFKPLIEKLFNQGTGGGEGLC